jgi:hypothetical protein
MGTWGYRNPKGALLTDKTQASKDEDPGPIKHSDAERVTADKTKSDQKAEPQSSPDDDAA